MEFSFKGRGLRDVWNEKVGNIFHRWFTGKRPDWPCRSEVLDYVFEPAVLLDPEKGVCIAACDASIHPACGVSYLHVPINCLQDLGTHHCEAEAPVILSSNLFRQGHIRSSNTIGRTVKLYANNGGASVFTLNRHLEDCEGQIGDWADPRYRVPYGFAFMHSRHLREHRLSQGFDDLHNWYGKVKSSCFRVSYL